jgi:hypothetical protein
VIIDSSKGFAAERKPMKADAILMHRTKNIVAVRAQQGENTIVQVSSQALNLIKDTY